MDKKRIDLFMRKLFLLFTLSLLYLTDIHAQKLNVESFVAKTNDITARTQSRQDINGNDCALVKVQLAASNAVFEGNVIGDVAYNTSEYFVYMAQGCKKLTVKLEGYLPLEVSFQDYEIKSLEPKTVYLLTVSGVMNGKEQEPVRTKTGWIILDSEPSGASVYINDEFVGNTPLSNYKQAYGTYQYRLESPNYHAATGTIELNASRFEQKVVLKPAFGSISVKSSIAGAKIMLDGKQTGKQTPATLTEIPSGSHTISLQKDKYAPRQQEVMVEDGQTANVSMTLDARFARINIKSLDEAEIYSNGRLLGKGRISEDMMEGYYDIEVRLDHHKSVTKQIQVVAGQSQNYTLNPIPKYGSLDIVSTPHDANITVDGKAYGKTPTTIESLLEGMHQIHISLEGYADYRSSVYVEEKETASISAILVNTTNINITSTNPNATLYIDGVEQGTASGIKMVSYGQHQIRLTANDWKDFNTTINVSDSQTSFRFTMEKSIKVSVSYSSEVQTITIGDVQFKMVAVEGGSFKKPTGILYGHGLIYRPVTLSSYSIGATEVTQGLWEIVMGNNPSKYRGENRPVEGVTWDDCQTFISKLNTMTGLNFRLPTAAEWEFAALGGNKSKGYKTQGGFRYSGSNTPDEVAWYGRSDGTHDVGTKRPNELGLYDMSGNVWEWCSDRYKMLVEPDDSPQTNPTGPESGYQRIIHGGAWNSSDIYDLHIFNNEGRAPLVSGSIFGFRLAL